MQSLLPCLHKSQYMTNFFARIQVHDQLHTNSLIVVDATASHRNTTKISNGWSLRFCLVTKPKGAQEMQQDLFLLQEESRVLIRKPYGAFQDQGFLSPASLFIQDLNGPFNEFSYSCQVYTNLGLSKSYLDYTNP